jgi:hypothetical protein
MREPTRRDFIYWNQRGSDEGLNDKPPYDFNRFPRHHKELEAEYKRAYKLGKQYAEAIKEETKC